MSHTLLEQSHKSQIPAANTLTNSINLKHDSSTA